MEYIQLNDGNKIPAIGFGVFMIPNDGQIILRFETQDGLVTLPKSTNPGRIASNLDVFGFRLTDDEMDAMRALDTGKGTHDPEDPVNEERLLAFHVHG